MTGSGRPLYPESRSGYLQSLLPRGISATISSNGSFPKVMLIKYLNILVLVIVGVIFQVNIFPAYLADPFKPNVLLIFVVYFGFRTGYRFGAPCSFLLGLIQDSFSGQYFGLNGFSFLLIFTLYHEVAARLYTGSRTLLVLGTMLAIVMNATIQFLLLLLFSTSDGAFSSIFGAILPQGFATALVAVCVVIFFPRAGREDFP
jgi:rod shape-determining protein MreD